VYTEKIKSDLRKSITARLASIPHEQFACAGVAAAARLAEIPGWNDFGTVLCFKSFKDEIDASPIIEASLAAGKKVFLPVVKGDKMEFISHGDTEAQGNTPNYQTARYPPCALCLREKFLIIVPGLAFDKKCRRLGRGRGYYDRFLSEINAPHFSCGLCLDCQIVERVPVEAHDVSLDAVLTEKRLHNNLTRKART
jgi:5-formyltetrahydrofolate cyclo-ligase